MTLLNLNEDCINEIMSFIPYSYITIKNHNVVFVKPKEAKEQTAKLYKSILEKVQFGKDTFLVGKTYVHITKLNYHTNELDLIIFKVVKKTRCYLFVKCSQEDDYEMEIENNAIIKKKISVDNQGDEFLELKKSHNNTRFILPCKCLEFDKLAHFNWYNLEAPKKKVWFLQTKPVLKLEGDWWISGI